MIPGKILTSSGDVLDMVFSSLKNNEPLLLTYFNQNCFNIYHEITAYKNLIDNKFSVYADGIGIFFVYKFVKRMKTSRIDATELNGKILKKLNENKAAVGIIGGNFNQEFIREQVHKHELNFSGYQNGFFPESQIPEIIEKVRSFKSQVILIGMGVPKQEMFGAELSRILDRKIIICVGNFLEYYFGVRRRAPVVFRTLGLEWVFRLINEPGRLWHRYLVGIPKFIIVIIKECFKKSVD